MTAAQLIDDLRARFPTFTVTPEGDLIHVEIPDARTVWIKLSVAQEEIRIATTREGTVARNFLDRRGTGPWPDPEGADYLLWCIACDIKTAQSPDELRRFIGGPFDAVARDLACTFAAGISREVDRERARIAAYLDDAKARAEREGAAADLTMKTAAAYLALVATDNAEAPHPAPSEPTP